MAGPSGTLKFMQQIWDNPWNTGQFATLEIGLKSGKKHIPLCFGHWKVYRFDKFCTNSFKFIRKTYITKNSFGFTVHWHSSAAKIKMK